MRILDNKGLLVMKQDIDFDNFPTHYWHALDDGRIQCDVCPHSCKLKEDQRGVCFVRARRTGWIYV